MKIYYSESIINYYLDELEKNKLIGIVSERQTGKSTLSLIIMIEQMKKHNMNAIIICEKGSTTLHVLDKLLFILTQYGINYTINSDHKYIKFDGLKVKYIKYVDIPKVIAAQQSDIICYLDELYYSIYRNGTDNLNFLYRRYKYILYTDWNKNPYLSYNPSKVIDNTQITEIKLRKLKLKRLLNV